ncbi:MAG: LysE family transporter, partial [Nitriliruptor sp.]
AAVVAGAGRLASLSPDVLTVVRWIGVAYLAAYATLAARRALRPRSALIVTHAAAGGRRSSAVLATLALTWLNPHFYVDMILVLGPVAATHGPNGWAFGAGFVVASALWFVGLGAAAKLLRPVFARPATWRVLDTAIALVMAALAVGVAIRG